MITFSNLYVFLVSVTIRSWNHFNENYKTIYRMYDGLV